MRGWLGVHGEQEKGREGEKREGGNEGGGREIGGRETGREKRGRQGGGTGEREGERREEGVVVSSSSPYMLPVLYLAGTWWVTGTDNDSSCW